jgi:uncharacterized membrane protein (UPF0127 family)
MGKNKITWMLLGLLLLAASCNGRSRPDLTAYADGTAVLAGQTVNIEVAETELKREQGLAGRTSLADDQGMLFLFSQPGQPVFWMKGMKFPIDIVWIADDKVVALTRNAEVQPQARTDGDYTRYSPGRAVTKVLELNSGWIDRFELKIGDQIAFKIAP